MINRLFKIGRNDKTILLPKGGLYTKYRDHDTKYLEFPNMTYNGDREEKIDANGNTVIRSSQDESI